MSRVRQAASRAEGQNNLKQLTLATINTADGYNGKMPPGPEGWYPAYRQLQANNGYGPCLFHILPAMDSDPLYKSSETELDQKKIYAAWTVAAKPVKTFIAHNDPTSEPGSDRTSYLANGLALTLQGTRFPATFTDGTSQTIFFAEAYSEATDAITWGGKTEKWKTERRWADYPVWMPAPSAVMFQVAPPRHEASARVPQGLTPAGIQVALGDGSARNVSAEVSAATFYAACTPNGNDVLGADW
jgi:hypothetical protein